MEAERPWETDVRVGPDAGSVVGHPLDSFCRALLDPNVQASAMATSSVLRTFRTPWPENRRAQGSRDRRLGIPRRRWRTRLYDAELHSALRPHRANFFHPRIFLHQAESQCVETPLSAHAIEHRL